jgi:hypothetical protein
MFRIRIQCTQGRRVTYTNLDVIKDAALAMLGISRVPGENAERAGGAALGGGAGNADPHISARPAHAGNRRLNPGLGYRAPSPKSRSRGDAQGSACYRRAHRHERDAYRPGSRSGRSRQYFHRRFHADPDRHLTPRRPHRRTLACGSGRSGTFGGCQPAPISHCGPDRQLDGRTRRNVRRHPPAKLRREGGCQTDGIPIRGRRRHDFPVHSLRLSG